MKILLLLLLLASFSCKRKEENSQLQIDMTTRAIGLPYTIQSCTDIATAATTKSVAKVAAKFPAVTFKWYSTDETLEIQYIELNLVSGSLTNGKQTIPVDDIDDFFGTTATFARATQDAQGNITPASLTTNCELRIGGIKVTDETSPAYISGTMRVVAQSTNPDNKNIAVVIVEKDIEIEYQGIGSR